MSLLPTKSDRSVTQEVEVVGLDEDLGDQVLEALASETAREILLTLNDEPKPANEISDALDTTLQNVDYHLDRLEGAGVIEPIETEYSEKGREMTVYGPTSQPLVIVSGSETGDVKAALRTLLGALAGLAVASLLAQLFLPAVPSREDIMNAAGGPAMPVPQGLVFFAGGAFVLAAIFAVWYVRNA